MATTAQAQSNATQVANDLQAFSEPPPRPELNGLMIKQPGDDRIYLVDTGYKRHLVPQNFDLLFIPSPQIQNWDVANVPTGSPLLPDSALIQASDMKPGVYLVTTAAPPASGQLVKRGIVSAEIFRRYQFDGSKIKLVPPIVVTGLPTGPDMPPPEEKK
jgi:hypothetical protein